MEPSMNSFYQGLFASLFTVGLAFSAPAQDRQPDRPKSQVEPPADVPLTGKERLGRKWTDEQRIDNCNVPIDKRGTKPRPITCTGASTGS
jgi:hypothetical protein